MMPGTAQYGVNEKLSMTVLHRAFNCETATLRADDTCALCA